MQLTFKNILAFTALLALSFFSFLMLRIMVKYIPVQTDVAFLQIKQDYIHITPWLFAFFVHVFSSILVLLAGFTQFSKWVQKHHRVWHRRLGYVYVLDILIVTGPASLLMAFFANGGWPSRLAFIVLAVLWLFFTGLALFKALKKDFRAHRYFMIRSYALTLSAITLRIWKVVLAGYTDLTPLERYRIIAWLGFGLNLLVAEWIIYRLRKKRENAGTKYHLRSVRESTISGSVN